jgi:SlyX protein
MLEFKVAYLERSLQELSDVVYRQQQLLEAMERRYQRLLDRVESAERGSDAPGGFEVPPHY